MLTQAGVYQASSNASNLFKSGDLPMSRHLSKPLDAGFLEGHVGVEAAGDGAVDDDLLLLCQERDQLPLRPHQPPHPPVHMIQIPHDGGLFGEGGGLHKEDT